MLVPGFCTGGAERALCPAQPGGGDDYDDDGDDYRLQIHKRSPNFRISEALTNTHLTCL